LTIEKEKRDISATHSRRSSITQLETGNGRYEPYRGAGPSVVVTGYDTAATVPDYSNTRKEYTSTAKLLARIRLILIILAFLASVVMFAVSIGAYAVYARHKHAGKVLPSGRWWIAWPSHVDLNPTIAIMIMSIISFVVDTGFFIGSLRKNVSQLLVIFVSLD